MQRRAAAVYATIFILVAAGAYAMIGAAQEPSIDLENPERTLSPGDEFSVNDRTYTANVEGGSAEFAWTEENARFTEAWENGSTVTVGGTEFRVLVDNGTPPGVDLVEVRTLPENASTTEINGTTYVVLETGEDPELVPRDEYIADRYGIPVTRRYTQGERLEYDNRTVTVDSISASEVVLAWTAPRENTVSASEGANVTLNGRTFVAHFPDASTVELELDYGAYARDVRVIDTYHERIEGLWGVSILSGFAAVMVLGMAYMPSRY